MEKTHGDLPKENIYLDIAKKVVVAVGIYYIGYYGLSLTWIAAPVALDILRQRAKRKRLQRREAVRKTVHLGEKEMLQNLEHLPAWVYFPDIERVEWLNKLIKQLWANVNHYAKDLIQSSIEPALKRNLEAYKISGFKFERLILGSVPFRLGGIKVYENVNRCEIVMDIDVAYAGDCDITFKVSKMKGGIKNFQLYGKLRVILKPLIRTIPFAGGLQAFFLNPPDIDFDLEGIAGVLEVPGIIDLLRKIVADTVKSMIVLPNKFPIRLSSEIDASDIKTPSPLGVLRIHVIEGKNLMKKDISITGKGKSDPYVVLQIGSQKYKTKIIDNTVMPKWDEWCEFIVEEVHGQELFIDVWDEDTKKDESLGQTTVEVASLVRNGQSDLWLSLEGVKHGQVHIRVTWLTFSTKYEDLQLALNELHILRVTSLNSALLVVFVDSASSLPQVKSSSKPDPYFTLKLGNQTHKSNTQNRQIDPVWEEGFIFFIQNPDADTLSIKITDSKTENNLGELTYNVSNLRDKLHLRVLKQPFRLHKSGNESKINLSLHLKVLKNGNNADTYVSTDPIPASDESETKSEKSDKPAQLKKQDSTVSLGKTSNNAESLDSSPRLSVKSSSSSLSTLSKVQSETSLYSMGQIQMTLKYSIQRQRLVVVIHNIRNIPIKEKGDPLRAIYVKLYLLPERNKDSKRKTQVVRSSHEVIFDETFEFLISQQDLPMKRLEISIIEDKIMKNEILGEVFIDFDSYEEFLQPKTVTYELAPETKKSM